MRWFDVTQFTARARFPAVAPAAGAVRLRPVTRITEVTSWKAVRGERFIGAAALARLKVTRRADTPRPCERTCERRQFDLALHEDYARLLHELSALLRLPALVLKFRAGLGAGDHRSRRAAIVGFPASST